MDNPNDSAALDALSGGGSSDNSGSNSGINWSNVITGGLGAGTTVFGDILKSQATGQQAAAAAAASRSTTMLIILGVVGLVVVGVLFAFIGHRK